MTVLERAPATHGWAGGEPAGRRQGATLSTGGGARTSSQRYVCGREVDPCNPSRWVGGIQRGQLKGGGIGSERGRVVRVTVVHVETKTGKARRYQVPKRPKSQVLARSPFRA